MTIFETLKLYFSYSFVQYALIVGVLVALCSSLLGVTLVLKRFSFIGDGLSHVAFLAMAIAAILQFTNSLPIILIITTIAAIAVLCMGENSLIKGDAIIAVISVSSLGIGYLLMNVFSTSSNISGDVCTTLFGSTSLLTLSKFEVVLSVLLSLIVIFLYIIFYNKIFAITFDEDFTKATGVNVSFYNLMMAVIIAIIIVLAMKLVGSLLTSALIIFPALSTMRIFKSFKWVVIGSAILSVICSVLGILISIIAGTPIGSTIVLIDILGYIICYILSKIHH